jgi:hypothetical protein
MISPEVRREITPEIRREIINLLQGSTFLAGSVTLSSTSSVTTLTRTYISATSCISFTPYNAGAKTEGIPMCVPTNGSAVLTHNVTSTSRIYTYVIHTPQ